MFLAKGVTGRHQQFTHFSIASELGNSHKKKINRSVDLTG
jgi:hypothetical protein